jgi:hypothetical protein
MQQPRDIEQPQNDCDYHYRVKDGLDGSLHWNKAIHQPQKDTNDDQNLDKLK